MILERERKLTDMFMKSEIIKRLNTVLVSLMFIPTENVVINVLEDLGESMY